MNASSYGGPPRGRVPSYEWVTGDAGLPIHQLGNEHYLLTATTAPGAVNPPAKQNHQRRKPTIRKGTSRRERARGRASAKKIRKKPSLRLLINSAPWWAPTVVDVILTMSIGV